MDSVNAHTSSKSSADQPPLVSICIPTYNGARFLSQCLDTALAQTWRDFELVIVDDRSTDATLEVAAAYAARDPRVRLHQNDQNLGLAGNWTRCVHLSRGQWIKFLFQDDLLAPSCLSKMLAIRRPDVPLIVCRRALEIEPDTPQDLTQWYQSHAAQHMLHSLFPNVSFVRPSDFAARVVAQPLVNCVGEPTATLIHRSAFDRFGPFNPNFKVLVDWEFFARIGVLHGLCYVDDELATFRVHSKSTTQTELARSSFRIYELDALIMLHELAYSAAFGPVRQLAMRRQDAIDFRFPLADHVRQARRKAKRIPGKPGREALNDLADLIRTYPRMAQTPRGYVFVTVSKALRHARWKLLRRAEDLVLKGRRAIRSVDGRHPRLSIGCLCPRYLESLSVIGRHSIPLGLGDRTALGALPLRQLSGGHGRRVQRRALHLVEDLQGRSSEFERAVHDIMARVG